MYRADCVETREVGTTSECMWSTVDVFLHGLGYYEAHCKITVEHFMVAGKKNKIEAEREREMGEREENVKTCL